MKMKKKRILSQLILFCALATIVLFAIACNNDVVAPEDKDLPVLTINSTNPATITVEETYTLSYTVDKASLGVTVSAIGGVYNANTKVFIPDNAGTAGLTVTAKNPNGETVKTITITVEPVEDPVPSEVVYDIIFAEYSKLTTPINIELTLPQATATSTSTEEEDLSNLTASILGDESALKLKSPGIYEVKTSVSGEVAVRYTLRVNGTIVKRATLTVNVVPNYAESIIAEEYTLAEGESLADRFSSINANKGTSAKYQENFSKGYSSPVMISQASGVNVYTPKISLEGTSNAIAGNSMILDFNNAIAPSSGARVYLSVGDFLTNGNWTIKLKIKTISGSAKDARLCFFPNGFDTSNRYSLTIPTAGTTQELTVNAGHIRFSSTGTVVALTFDSDNFSELKLAIDDIVIEGTSADYGTVNLSGAAMSGDNIWVDNKVTIDGTEESYSNLSETGNPAYVDTAKIKASGMFSTQQSAELTAENGFNKYSIHINGQLNKFDALNGQLIDPNYTYTISFNAISAMSRNWYFFAIGTVGAGYTFDSTSIVDGCSYVKEYIYIIDKGDMKYTNCGLYLDGIDNMIIGQINVVRSDFTKTPLKVDRTGAALGTSGVNSVFYGSTNSKTLNLADGNYPELTNSAWDQGNSFYTNKATIVSSEYMVQSDVDSVLTSANGFEDIHALVLGTQTTFLGALNKKMTDPTKVYTIKIWYYANVRVENYHVWAGGTSIEAFTAEAGANTFTSKSFRGNQGYIDIGFYNGEAGKNNILIGKIEVTRANAPSSATIIRTPTPMATNWVDNVLTLSGAAGNYTSITWPAGGNTAARTIDLSKFEAEGVATKATVQALIPRTGAYGTGFESGFAIQAFAGTLRLEALNNITQGNGYTYKIEVYYYAAAGGAIDFYIPNHPSHHWTNPAINLGATTKSFGVLTLQNIVSGAGKAEINCQNPTIEIYLGKIVVTRRPTEAVSATVTRDTTSMATNWVDNVLTLSGAAGNYTSITWPASGGNTAARTIDLSKFEAEDVATKATVQALIPRAGTYGTGFESGFAIQAFGGTISFDALKDITQGTGYTYKIEIYYYAANGGEAHFYILNHPTHNWSHPNDLKKFPITGSFGVMTLSNVGQGTGSVDINFQTPSIEIYLGKIMVTRTAI